MTAVAEARRPSLIERLPLRSRAAPATVTLILLLIVAGIVMPAFLLPERLLVLGVQVAPLAMVATGQTIVLLIGGLDLSVGSVLTLSLVLGAGLTGGSDDRALTATLVCLGVGTGIGILNGLIIVGLRIPPLITTIATATAVQGVSWVYTNGAPNGQMPESIKYIANGRIGAVPIADIVMLLTLVVSFFVLSQTVFGRQLYAIGANPRAAALTGIRINVVTVTAYALSGALAAVGGLIRGWLHRRRFAGCRRGHRGQLHRRRAHRRHQLRGWPGRRGGHVHRGRDPRDPDGAPDPARCPHRPPVGDPRGHRDHGGRPARATGEQLSGTVGCRTEATPALSREWPRRPEEGRMTRRSPGGLKAFVAPLLAAATVAALALPAVAQDNLDPAQFNTGKQPPYTIGVSNDSVANPFRVQMLNEIEYFAKAHPELIKELVVLNAGEDTNKQLSDVQDLISRGVDGIVLSPNSSTAFDSVLDEATAATIPVATYNMTVEDGSKVIAQIAPPFQAWQKQTTQWLADQMGGKGNVIVLRGIAGTPVDALEWAGAKEVLDANPDMKVICEEYANWTTAPARPPSRTASPTRRRSTASCPSVTP